MGRAKRAEDGGAVFHVLNRANMRATLFETPEDYAAFERVLQEAVERTGMRVLAYCVMPNHWHLVVWPRQDGDLSKFMGWLTLTHTQRWHASHGTVGTGHLYQGRFKSFPIQADEYFLTVCRYVERNALRANLVALAEDWAYGSLYHRLHKTEFAQAVLSKWPVPQPRQWRSHATNRKPSPRLSPSAAASIEAPHWGIRNGPNAP